jgi:hypothetical protein
MERVDLLDPEDRGVVTPDLTPTLVELVVDLAAAQNDPPHLRAVLGPLHAVPALEGRVVEDLPEGALRQLGDVARVRPQHALGRRDDQRLAEVRFTCRRSMWKVCAAVVG